ncbi:MAG: COX15/CtaA family protein [Acidobacteriia bacterium]|nr:COX15/CtaA family protein [Terriglobia bacterium]
MRRFAKFAWAVLGFNLLVILWGALVRASRSGEGCGDHWPLCNGTVIPHAAEIATIIEFTHRATTGIAFFSVVAMALWAFRAYRPGPIWRGAMASLVLIVTEALLGAGLVLFRYTGADVSAGRAIYLSAHLVNTLLMLAAMALTAWWASGHRGIEWSGKSSRLLGWAIVAALIVGVSGAIAALSDTLFPQTSLRAGLEADFSSASPMLMRLRIWHPAIAVAAGLYIAAVAMRLGRGLRLGMAVIALVGLQLAAGVVNLALLAPVWMQLVHLLLADLLWIALVLFSADILEKPLSDKPAVRPRPMATVPR